MPSFFEFRKTPHSGSLRSLTQLLSSLPPNCSFLAPQFSQATTGGGKGSPASLFRIFSVPFCPFAAPSTLYTVMCWGILSLTITDRTTHKSLFLALSRSLLAHFSKTEFSTPDYYGQEGNFSTAATSSFFPIGILGRFSFVVETDRSMKFLIFSSHGTFQLCMD